MPKHEAQLKSGQGHIVPFMPLHLLCNQFTQLPQKMALILTHVLQTSVQLTINPYNKGVMDIYGAFILKEGLISLTQDKRKK